MDKFERKFTIEVMVSPDGEVGYQTVVTSDQIGRNVGVVDGLMLPAGINLDLQDILPDGEAEFLDSTVVGDYGNVTLMQVYYEVEDWVKAQRARQASA